jgi:hypothetical protein
MTPVGGCLQCLRDTRIPSLFRPGLKEKVAKRNFQALPSDNSPILRLDAFAVSQATEAQVGAGLGTNRVS